MSDFLDKAKIIGAKAYSQAGDALEVGKYKAKIISKKAEIDKVYMEIGRFVYDKYADNDDGIDQEIIDKCSMIDSMFDEIIVMEEKIESVKHDEKNTEKKEEVKED